MAHEPKALDHRYQEPRGGSPKSWPSWLSRDPRRPFPHYEREARDRHTELAFAFADEALSRNCLDSADRVYRDHSTFHVGATYSGIRDRAKLGIEDVRSRRGATPNESK